MSSSRLGGSRARSQRFLQWDFIPRAPTTFKPRGKWRDLLQTERSGHSVENGSVKGVGGGTRRKLFAVTQA